MRILIIIILCSGAFSMFAQNAAFEKAILKGKRMVQEADGDSEFQNAANYFERIANKEQGEWLPLYYQAQSFAFMASNKEDADAKESLLNKSLDLLEKAKSIEKNAEITAMEGFVQMLRLTVDPATRGQTLSPKIFGLFNQALEMDPQNPRAILFLGQMHYGTAQFFGSGFDEACGYLQKAYDIFEEQSDEDTIYPTWGKGSAKASLENCNQ